MRKGHGTKICSFSQVTKFLRTPFLHKDTFFTQHLRMAASITHRVSFLRSFVFASLDISVLLRCRCLMSKFSEISLLLCRKIFSAFYLILHEAFSNSYGFPLMLQFNLFSPHLALYMIESWITGGVRTIGGLDIVIIVIFFKQTGTYSL